jgi:hypothetical protein
MTLEEDSTILQYESKMMMTIPTKMWYDTDFPFKKGDKITIRRQGQKLIVTKKGKR